MGYGKYGSSSSSSSYSSYGSSSYGGGSYTSRSSSGRPSSTYGGYSTTTTTTRPATNAKSSTQTTAKASTTQKATVAQPSAQQKNSTPKAAAQKGSPVPDRLQQQNQKTAEPQPMKSALKKTTTQKTTTVKNTGQTTTVQKTVVQQSSSETTSTQKASGQQKAAPDVSVKKTVTQNSSQQETTVNVTPVQNVSVCAAMSSEKKKAAQEVKEEEEVPVRTSVIKFSEGVLSAKKETTAATAKTSGEKSAEQLKLEKDKFRQKRQEKDLHDMELQVTKHPKFLALQDKLNERLYAKQGGREKMMAKSNIKPPTGNITYGLVSVKNTASFLELSLSNEEATLKTLEDIHDLLDSEFQAHKVYKVEAELGKFLLVAQSVEEMINLSMKIQTKFNEHEWNGHVLNLPMFRKLLRPEDLLNDDAVPLFNGPRLTVGIHNGESLVEAGSEGQPNYCGINILQVESIAKFAQGGQVLMSAGAWSRVNQSKLLEHHMSRIGIFKLDDFSESGCSLVDIIPEHLKDREKFFGSICSHCTKGIQPWEKSLEMLNCIWHTDHFKCFNCCEDVGEESYVAHQGSPYCNTCYLDINSKPKCKKCLNNISKEYINALGGYWHANCFSCKQCRKKPSASTPLYEYNNNPYCEACHEKVRQL